MNDPVQTRRYVREVLALNPARELTERMLLDAVNRLSREPLGVDELAAALQWNAARRLIESRTDDDLDGRTVFKLTLTGKQKEGLA